MTVQHENSSADAAPVNDVDSHSNTQNESTHAQLEPKDVADVDDEGQDMSLILHGKELVLVFIGIMLAVFLVGKLFIL